MEQTQLNGLQLVQFEYPKVKNPCVSSIFEVFFSNPTHSVTSVSKTRFRVSVTIIAKKHQVQSRFAGEKKRKHWGIEIEKNPRAHEPKILC